MVQIFWGEWVAYVIGAAIAVIVFLVAGASGIQAATTKLAIAGGTYGLLGLSDLIRHRYLGEIALHRESAARALLRVDDIEGQIHALKHPDELDLFIEERISAWVIDVALTPPDVAKQYTHAVVYLLGLTITNREGSRVTLDCTADIYQQRKGPDGKQRRTIGEMWEKGLINADAVHRGPIKIEAHDTVEVTKALTITEMDWMFFEHCGIQKGASHTLRFFDRNSGKLTRRNIELFSEGPLPSKLSGLMP